MTGQGIGSKIIKKVAEVRRGVGVTREDLKKQGYMEGGDPG